jgi:hypothetical protein
MLCSLKSIIIFTVEKSLKDATAEVATTGNMIATILKKQIVSF